MVCPSQRVYCSPQRRERVQALKGKTDPYINQCETHVTPARPSTEQNQRNNDEEQKDEKLR